MDQEATQTEPEKLESTTQTETAPAEEVRNPDAVLAKNKELLGTIKSLKSELTEFKTAQEKAKEEKLIEDGKLQELLDAKEEQLKELNPYKGEAEQYRNYFEKKLETAKEGLSEVQIKAVDGFNGSLSEKLSMAEEFKGSIPNRTSSPGSERPGANNKTSSFNVNDYRGIEGKRKLNSLYDTDRDLYNEIAKAIKTSA